MVQMPKHCPSCQGTLSVERLCCPACQTELKGSYDVPALLRLSAGDLDFITRFIRASGSLKAIAKEEGQSYPTIRNRLDRIIEALDEEQDEQEAHKILDAVADGTLSVKAAALRLKRSLT